MKFFILIFVSCLALALADPIPPVPKPKAYDYGEVLGLSLLFYEAQRCGRLPASNRIPWRGDSFLWDADELVDLRGGYFDAGDHVKFGFPMAFTTTVIGWGLLDFREGYESAGEYENGLAVLRWALDYFIRAHPAPNVFYGQVGNGNIDHGYWGRPEDWPSNLERPAFKITADAPGSDLASETAAALAVGYLIYKDRNPSFAEECLRHAEELYNFANTYRGLYHESITDAASFYRSWSYGDELGWAAAWLYRATMDQKYLDSFRSHWDEFYLVWKPEGFGWDNKNAGLQVLMAQVTGEQEYKDAAQAFCDWLIDEAPRTPKNLTFLGQWGSLRSISGAVHICLHAADLGISPGRYRDYTAQQIGYILGDTGRSFVVGYGENPPTQPHHRASSCPDRPAPCGYEDANFPGPNPQILYGALVGGPDEEDNYNDDRGDWVQNEVATDYNAGFQSVLAGLAQLTKRSN